MAQPTNPQGPSRQTNPDREQRRDQQFGPSSTPSQRPAGSQSRTDMDEDDESLEPVEHYRKGENEANAGVEEADESSTSTTRKINR